MFWYGPTSETGWVQRMQRYWSKYANFMKQKKITSRIYKNYSNYYASVANPSNFIAVHFAWIKKMYS